MTKLTFETANFTDKNIEKIAKLFPNVITEVKDEGKSTPEKTVYKKSVNFELLKQELSADIVDGDECYDFNWVGKKACILEGNKPIRETLRPCIEESKDWEHTGNLYIEGDNLDVLKLLQESYLNSVKMVYIDPPYNTGNDSFIYPDNFTMDKDDYEEQTEFRDDDDNINYKQNNEANPRFHSDWCSMMYPRLKLAQNLLTDDGVIFISIDDNEVHNLRKMCDEVFGESNFEGHIHWRRRHNQPNDRTKMVGLVAEHILAYAKSSKILKEHGVGKIDLTGNFSNPDNDPRGEWASKPWKVGSDQSGSRYSIKTPSGKVYNEEWMGEENTFISLLNDGRILFPNNNNGMPRKKYYKFEREKEGQCATNWWSHEKFGHNQGANDCMTQLFQQKNIFSNPKPVELLRGLIQISNAKLNDIILDFFSGSATTAHAVMQLNAEDGGNRKFIMVQLPELCGEKSEAYKAGYKNICEIGKERIRRAGEKIKAKVEKENAQLKLDEEPKKVPDIGFRVLKIDSTNMEKVYYSPEDYTQEMLNGMESNIKEDRTDLDLLYGVLLDWGLELTKNHKIVELYGVRVHCYDFIETESENTSNSALIPNCSLVACFADKVGKDVIRAIAKSKPLRAVFRDSSFTDCQDKINVEEIFKYYAPDTSVKVI